MVVSAICRGEAVLYLRTSVVVILGVTGLATLEALS